MSYDHLKFPGYVLLDHPVQGVPNSILQEFLNFITFVLEKIFQNGFFYLIDNDPNVIKMVLFVAILFFPTDL